MKNKNPGQVAQFWNSQNQFCYKKVTQRVKLSEEAKLFWNLRLCFYQLTEKKKKKVDFKLPSLFCPRWVSVCKKQNRALFSLNLQEQRALHKKGVIYSLYPQLEANDKGTFSLRSGNILASLPKPITERWAPLPNSSYPATLALRTGGFVFRFI